jgi:hypothetical protein
MKVLDKFPGKPRRAKKVWTPDTISPEELKRGCIAFRERERRDAMYKTATFLMNHFWGKPTEVAEGLGVLLCVWNNVFYRLADKFGDDLKAVQSAMKKLAKAYKSNELAKRAYALYERFRPSIPEGVKGWGAKGDLDLGLIERLGKERVEAKRK